MSRKPKHQPKQPPLTDPDLPSLEASIEAGIEPPASAPVIKYCSAVRQIGRSCYKPAGHNSPAHKSVLLAEECPACRAQPGVECDASRHSRV